MTEYAVYEGGEFDPKIRLNSKIAQNESGLIFIIAKTIEAWYYLRFCPRIRRGQKQKRRCFKRLLL
ncbi:MAG: hypothetical protein LBR79_04895 [Oscillospiraceae bacterium]|jgi:hypothetical protein|nr:hypothetical protein [Oscillospiraceae bacterium]